MFLRARIASRSLSYSFPHSSQSDNPFGSLLDEANALVNTTKGTQTANPAAKPVASTPQDLVNRIQDELIKDMKAEPAKSTMKEREQATEELNQQIMRDTVKDVKGKPAKMVVEEPLKAMKEEPIKERKQPFDEKVKTTLEAVDETIMNRRLQKHAIESMSSLFPLPDRKKSLQRTGPVSLTTSHLLASGAHLGHHPKLTNRAYLPHIYGTRAGVSIIDLNQTLPSIRRAANIIRGTVENDGRVVFVAGVEGSAAILNKAIKRMGPNGYAVSRWLPGTISNARTIFSFPTLTTKSAAELPPSLLVVLDPLSTTHAIKEATSARIPTIGIVDSNLDPRSVTYPILANSESLHAVELIVGVLTRAGEEGLQSLRAKRAKLHDATKGSFVNAHVGVQTEADIEANAAQQRSQERY